MLFVAFVLYAGFGVTFTRVVSAQEFASSLMLATREARDALLAWWSDHYQRVPTLVLGLTAVVIFPIIAIGAAVVRTLSGGGVEGDDMTVSTEQHLAGQTCAMPVPDRIVCTAGKPVWPSKAIVELRDPTGRRRPARFAVARPVVQIGRSDDVDIVIRDPTVHRHHATIHCTEDAEYLVTDLSAGTGNGVVVNGHPVLQHQIFNGDEIRLGRARLMFLTAQT